MKKIKKIGLLVVLICIMATMFAIPAMADPLDDVIAGKVGIGEVVNFKGYDWYYMGNGYFISKTLDISGNRRYDDNYNTWVQSELSRYLNTTFYQNTLNSDNRIAYMTIPSKEEYEDQSITSFANMEKGNGLTY